MWERECPNTRSLTTRRGPTGPTHRWLLRSAWSGCDHPTRSRESGNPLLHRITSRSRRHRSVKRPRPPIPARRLRAHVARGRTRARPRRMSVRPRRRCLRPASCSSGAEQSTPGPVRGLQVSGFRSRAPVQDLRVRRGVHQPPAGGDQSGSALPKCVPSHPIACGFHQEQEASQPEQRAQHAEPNAPAKYKRQR